MSTGRARGSYFIHRQQLWTQDPISIRVRLRVDERMKSGSCNISSTDERDLAVSTSCVELALFLD
jgi:hypothetical protein